MAFSKIIKRDPIEWNRTYAVVWWKSRLLNYFWKNSYPNELITGVSILFCCLVEQLVYIFFVAEHSWTSGNPSHSCKWLESWGRWLIRMFLYKVFTARISHPLENMCYMLILLLINADKIIEKHRVEDSTVEAKAKA